VIVGLFFTVPFLSAFSFAQPPLWNFPPVPLRLFLKLSLYGRSQQLCSLGPYFLFLSLALLFTPETALDSSARPFCFESLVEPLIELAVYFTSSINAPVVFLSFLFYFCAGFGVLPLQPYSSLSVPFPLFCFSVGNCEFLTLELPSPFLFDTSSFFFPVFHITIRRIGFPWTLLHRLHCALFSFSPKYRQPLSFKPKPGIVRRNLFWFFSSPFPFFSSDPIGLIMSPFFFFFCLVPL